MKILVLGYGNISRMDDGVGWFVAEQLKERSLPGVEVLTAHQLDVDMAETVSVYDKVIFVDASIPQGNPAVACSVVKPRLEAHAVAHYLAPSDVLAMADMLYGAQPDGILFTIPARNLNFGSTLSPDTEQAAYEVVRQITALAKEAMAGSESDTTSHNAQPVANPEGISHA